MTGSVAEPASPDDGPAAVPTVMTPRQRAFIATSQIAGGALVMANYVQIALTVPGALAYWQLVSALLVGVVSMAAGVGLQRGRAAAVRWSMLIQALQVVACAIGGAFRWIFLAGLGLRVVGSTSGVQLEGMVGGHFIAVPWNRDGALDAIGHSFALGIGILPRPIAASTATVGVNLVALYCLWLLLRTARQEATVSGPTSAPVELPEG